METASKFKHIAVLSPLFLLPLPPSNAADRTPVVFNLDNYCGDLNVSEASVSGLSQEFKLEDNVQTLTISEEERKWTNKMAKRFDELAELEAFGRLTTQQAQELEHLSMLRRRLLNPRSAEEILWEYSQRQITEKLLAVVKEYAEFHQRSNR